jgi:hypothetical protein
VLHTSALALRAFPHTITPNKLVGELATLTETARLKLPLVEELAADIFQGSFTAKFAAAARTAGRMLAGTLYQRYYAIDTNALVQLNDQSKLSTELAAIASRRAQVKPGVSVAGNGKILEQVQILTTHNLAVLFMALPLADALAADNAALVERCFTYAVERLSRKATRRRVFLHNLKSAAYAWRQLVFFLSFAPDPATTAAHLRGKLAKRDPAFVRRFEPAMRGLELAIAGVASNRAEFVKGGGHVLTGWSTERHWLSPPELAGADDRHVHIADPLADEYDDYA